MLFYSTREEKLSLGVDSIYLPIQLLPSFLPLYIFSNVFMELMYLAALLHPAKSYTSFSDSCIALVSLLTLAIHPQIGLPLLLLCSTISITFLPTYVFSHDVTARLQSSFPYPPRCLYYLRDPLLRRFLHIFYLCFCYFTLRLTIFISVTYIQLFIYFFS